MTLKERFKEEKIYINPYSFKLTTESAETFEQIVDEFAVEFADWLIKRQTNYFESLKELLQIFKKEKGL